jgi:hypothetical protein
MVKAEMMPWTRSTAALNLARFSLVERSDLVCEPVYQFGLQRS